MALSLQYLSRLHRARAATAKPGARQSRDATLAFSGDPINTLALVPASNFLDGANFCFRSI